MSESCSMQVDDPKYMIMCHPNRMGERSYVFFWCQFSAKNYQNLMVESERTIGTTKKHSRVACSSFAVCCPSLICTFILEVSLCLEDAG